MKLKVRLLAAVSAVINLIFISFILSYTHNISFLSFSSINDNDHRAIANVISHDLNQTSHIRSHLSDGQDNMTRKSGNNITVTKTAEWKSTDFRPLDVPETVGKWPAENVKSTTFQGLLDTLKERVNLTDWQTVDIKVYVYSAYHDRRTKHVVITSITAIARQAMICVFWYVNTQSWTFVPASSHPVPESHGTKYAGGSIQCSLGNTLVPDYVSVAFETVNVRDKDGLLAALNNLHPVISTQHDNYYVDFAVCISPLHSNYSNTNELVEFIEVNRLFGAQHFIFYDAVYGEKLQPYIDYYTAEGVVSMFNWTLPAKLKKPRMIHYYGQLAALNDCLYKGMRRTKYLAMLDLDEFIVPMQHQNWSEVIRFNTGFKDRHALWIFQNVFFKKDWPSDPKYEGDELVQEYQINTLLKTKRERKVWPHRSRSKYIIIPEYVSNVGVHDIYSFIDRTFTTKLVDRDSAMIYHYRDWEEPNKPLETENKRMHDFSMDILERIIKVHSHVAGKTEKTA